MSGEVTTETRVLADGHTRYVLSHLTGLEFDTQSPAEPSGCLLKEIRSSTEVCKI